MTPKIIYEDDDVVVINKPAGLIVHPVKKFAETEKTLVDWLVKKYPKIKTVGDDPENRPGIVHRLDKTTSGVMIIAKTQPAFDYLKKLFQEHDLHKTYIALVWGRIEKQSGIIDRPIGVQSGTLKRTVHIKNAKLVKEAKTIYRVKKYINGLTLVEVEPLTGRTHQIRIHLSSMRHPIVGDHMYGKKSDPFRAKRPFLHADALELTLPSGGRMKFSADLPPELDLKQFETEEYR